MAVVFSPEVFEKICEKIAKGQSLRRICEAQDMPSRTAVMKWLDDPEKDLVDQYARARDAQADFYSDEIIEIADTTDDPQKARLQIDARKWKASKMAPKKYGDKLDLSHSGKIKTVSRIELVAPKVDDDSTD